MTTLAAEKQRLIDSFKIPLYFVALIWAIKIFETFSGISLSFLGVLPKHINGLLGILTHPLVHGDWMHLFSNSAPMIVLGFLLLHSYQRIAWKVLPMIYFGTGIIIWLVARENYHIGASGLIYGLAFFIAFSGFFRKDVKSVALALLVVFLYGGLVIGLFNFKPGVSFEGHIAGAIMGIITAWRFKGKDMPERFLWDDVEEEEAVDIVEEPFWVDRQSQPKVSRSISIEGEEARPKEPESTISSPFQGKSTALDALKDWEKTIEERKNKPNQQIAMNDDEETDKTEEKEQIELKNKPSRQIPISGGEETEQEDDTTAGNKDKSTNSDSIYDWEVRFNYVPKKKKGDK